MNSFSHKSRSVLLVFNEKLFYERLNSVNASQKALFISELDEHQTKPIDDDSSAKQSTRIELNPLVIQSSYKMVNKYLGLETELLFFDATSQFDVNAFTAICGTLVGGGELVMLLDSRLQSNIESRSCHTGISETSTTLLRFVKFLATNQRIESTSLDSETTRYALKFNHSENLERDDSVFRDSQQQLIKDVKRCATGHAKRPIVLSANRGRGKSAALGIATAELLKETNIDIHVTAPRKQQLSIFFRHLHQRLEELTDKEEALQLIEKRLVFVPPDEAGMLPKISGLLIIEEAGSIPTQILSRFLSNSNRMIFSTTIDGYEGNGQGFEIRFKQLLKELFPQFKPLTLIQPARWSNSDLLEEALNTAFLLSVSKAKQDPPINNDRTSSEIEFYLVTKHQLNKDEELLKSVFQLLVNAHYQTRPSDLEKILSQSTLSVFIASIDERVVGACLTCHEGPLTERQITQIQDNNARLSGNLLPQSLVANQGYAEAGCMAFLRIMRIAISSSYRRQGVASQLLKYIDHYAREHKIDFIGTSFSLFSDVVRFWYANRFAAVRIGIRRDSSTGAHTGEFLKVVNSSDKTSYELHHLIINKFNRSFCYLASSSLKIVSSDVLLFISLMQPHLRTNSRPKLAQSNLIRKEVEQYLTQKRSLEMVEWQLYIMTKRCLFSTYQDEPINTQNDLRIEDLELVFAKIIQRKSWQEIVSQFQFTGIKQSREKSRLAFEALFSRYNNS